MLIIRDPFEGKFKVPYYCYVHKRSDETPFYVGKGTYARATHLTDRNQYYQEMVARLVNEDIIVELYPCETEALAFEIERLFIAGYKALETLCNITDGGDGGWTIISEATRLKMSAAQKGNQNSKGHQNWLGKHHTPETKAKIAKANMGHPNWCPTHSEETRKKLSELHKGRPKTLEHRHKLALANLGKKDSPGTRLKKSLAQKGIPKPRKTKL